MNDFDEKQKLKSKRPAMRLYTPPCNPVKRSDSLTESNNNKIRQEDGLLLKDDYKCEDKLNDCFDSLNLNETTKPTTSTNTTSKSISPQAPPRSNNSYSSDDEFSNMLEVYDLSPDLKSQDIRASLYQLETGDYEIKWVNESRAIIIFSTKSIANEALKLPCHNLKLRHLSQGSAESKQKARQCENHLPFKQRPETSACLARRLVSGALGIRVEVSKQQREFERKKLQDARGKF